MGRIRITLIVLLALGVHVPNAVACPFCTALKPTLSQRRDAAAAVVLGECTAQTNQRDQRATFRVRQTLSGADRLSGATSVSLKTDQKLKPGTLALLFASGSAKTTAADLSWECVPVDETSLAYFFRSPAPRTKSADRLEYFVRFLQHADPLLAEDAYQEFGHARFDELVEMADALPQEKLRTWLTDDEIPQHRQGLYAVALALAPGEADRRANVALLEKLIDEPASDFRAGFDGVLGGYLMLRGQRALDRIEEKYLVNPRAAEGDLRHALSALRFYCQYGREIPPERMQKALRRLLDRPALADQAIVDLARLKDWGALEKIVSLYDDKGYPQPATGRAVVGYLSACTAAEAELALTELRRRDPRGVEEAQQQLAPLDALKQ